MNSLERTWLNWKHGRKFARVGKRCVFPFPDLTVSGHAEIGDMCRFRNNVTLRTHGEGRILLGSRSGFSWNCFVEAWDLVKIGNRTALAENCIVSDGIFELAGNEKARAEALVSAAPIVVGDNVFVGSGCFIGPGVTIGDSAVIAPHSVVLRDVGPFEIWSGSPARLLGHRVEGVPEQLRREVAALIAQQGVQEDRNLGQYRYH